MHKNRNLALAGAFTALFAAGDAAATNGYFSHAYSVKEKGLAGAGTALAQDSLAAAANPAGMVDVGNRIDAGVALFSPHRSYTVEGAPSGAPAFGLVPETVDSDSEYFLIPHFGWNRMLDDDRALGVSVYANGGMNTDWPDSAGGGAGTYFGGFFGGEAETGVDLAQLFVNVSYAQRLNDSTAWGVSPILAYQRFEATGLAAFSGFSSDPDNLTDNGHDTSIGYGARIGITSEVQTGLTLGAAYQTEMRMDEFDQYRGLFAEQGGFNIPATMALGLAWETSPATMLLLDIQHIWYSDIASVGHPMAPQQLTTGTQLGSDDGAGFGWEDVTVFKLGYQWVRDEDWTWRVGYSRCDQPIPDSEVLFNILAPGVMEQHLTAGFTRRLGDAGEWTFAAMYSPEEEVSGANPLDPGQTITLRMDEWELAASYAWKF